MVKEIFRITLMVSFILAGYNSIGQNSYIEFGNRIDLLYSISLPKKLLSLSDSNLFDNNISMEITNKSPDNVTIYGFIEYTPSFKETAQLPVDQAYYIYKVQKYNELKGYWEDKDNNEILNNIDYVESPNRTRIKTLKQNNKYTQNLSLLGELNLSKIGKYKIQIHLGVKVRQNAFIIFSSNTIEVELVK